jgi:cell division protein FtsQ
MDIVNDEVEPIETAGVWDDPQRLATVTKAVLSAVLLALMAAVLWWAIHRPMFTITALVVEGPNHTAPRHVTSFALRSDVLPQLRGNFFTMDLEKTREAFESLAWVHAASVRRRWPNSLVITLDEHVPVGTWGENGDLLSSQGVSFMGNMAEAEEYGQLAAFNGPAGTERVVSERYKELQLWLAPAKLQPVSVKLSERLSWTVELGSGTTLTLGRDDSPESIHQRINRFLSVYGQLRARLGERIETVDLRYPHGMAIKAAGLKLKPIPTTSRAQ